MASSPVSFLSWWVMIPRLGSPFHLTAWRELLYFLFIYIFYIIWRTKQKQMSFCVDWEETVVWSVSHTLSSRPSGERPSRLPLTFNPYRAGCICNRRCIKKSSYHLPILTSSCIKKSSPSVTNKKKLSAVPIWRRIRYFCLLFLALLSISFPIEVLPFLDDKAELVKNNCKTNICTISIVVVSEISSTSSIWNFLFTNRYQIYWQCFIINMQQGTFWKLLWTIFFNHFTSKTFSKN
jgi:hypothetical protein